MTAGRRWLVMRFLPDLRQKWYTAWRLDQTIGKLCPDCNRDFSTLVPILGKRYPHDRMGLLSYTQDGVIRKFFGNQSEQQFQQNLTAMAKSTIDPPPNFHYYFVSGTGHTFLFTPGLTTVKGVSLLGWISAWQRRSEMDFSDSVSALLFCVRCRRCAGFGVCCFRL